MAHRTCLIGKCERRAKARSLCNKHYQYAMKHDLAKHFPPLGKARRLPISCAVKGCGRTATATVYCHMHYLRIWKGGDVGRPGPMVKVIRGMPEKRFWAKVAKTDDCWIWVGHVNPNGYGSFWNGKRTMGAHRFAYELLVGPIPEGHVVDHLCRVRKCVNPAHLEAVTTRENIMRGESLMAKWARGELVAIARA